MGGAGAPGSGQWEGGKELVIKREGIYKAGEGRRGSKWKEGQGRRSSSSFFAKQDRVQTGALQLVGGPLCILYIFCSFNTVKS